MKTKLVLMVVGFVGVLALISAGYCVWLMTVPLSYNWVPVVLIGFVVAGDVFVIASIPAYTEYPTDQSDLTNRLNGH
jgi:hypothetical protein